VNTVASRTLLADGLRAGAVSTHTATRLTTGWSLAGTPPGTWGSPGDAAEEPCWRPAVVPGTVARAIGPHDLDAHPRYDASDWWYRCRVPASAVDDGARVRLRFEGLATLARAWLGGREVLATNNMFQAHAVDVTEFLSGGDADLYVVFRSLDAALAERRRRPRWRTKLVAEPDLRWLRTTLLGRIPGWTPAVQPVGPWRSVWLEVERTVHVERLEVVPGVKRGRACLRLDGDLTLLDQGNRVRAATLSAGDDAVEVDVEVTGDGASVRVQAEAELDGVEPWWPHTHGTPALHPGALRLDTAAGPVTVDLGRMGFRNVSVDRAQGGVRFVVNGAPVFCRGACWTSNDMVDLTGPDDALVASLELAVEAGANMVRVGGTMCYESDRFYDLCDELGLMVWQDFMFANMDYPAMDRAFVASVAAEANQQLLRLQRHPSVVVWCGGSEVEQQAAMVGAPREIWSDGLFSEVLPDLVAERRPGTPYWTSTPTGGALPFHVGTELTHYYGVGAYLRPLEDARLADVKFTPECLGFSNVPEPGSLRAAGLEVAPHDPAWKRGVPRDTGAGWDFEDVRDHYLGAVHGVDPVALRSSGPTRYLALSRTVTGHLLERVFREWRSSESACGGGLVWFFRDLRPGAGWGIVDSGNTPKAVYHYLRRAWAPVTVSLLDRGLDGLRAEIHNERSEPLDAALELEVIARGSVVTARAREPVLMEPGTHQVFSADALIGYFLDLTYAYRFGPLGHEAVVARLTDGEGRTLAQDVFRPHPRPATPVGEVEASVRAVDADTMAVALTSPALLYDTRIDAEGFLASDNYFTLLPGRPHRVVLRRRRGFEGAFAGFVEAANLEAGATLGA
jgi:beta-mannosidase